VVALHHVVVTPVVAAVVAVAVVLLQLKSAAMPLPAALSASSIATAVPVVALR